MNKGTLLRGIAVLGIVWAVVWGVMAWSGNKKATPEKVTELIEDAEFEDWSGEDPASFLSERRKARLEKLNELGDVMNRLDLRQQEQVEENGDAMSLFLRLNPEEQSHFVGLIVEKRSAAFMNALDEMKPEERKQTIDRAMKALTRGSNKGALDQLIAKNPQVIDEIVNKGMKSFYQDASAEMKMELAPFLNAVGKVVQGFEQPGREGL